MDFYKSCHSIIMWLFGREMSVTVKKKMQLDSESWRSDSNLVSEPIHTAHLEMMSNAVHTFALVW